MSYDDGFRDSPAFRDSVAYREDAAARGTNGRYDDQSASMYSLGVPGLGYPAEDPLPSIDPLPVPPPPPGPVRDRLGVHLMWELALLVGAAAVAFLLWRAEPSLLKGAALTDLYLRTAVLGALAVGTALSLRAAVPNLAIGPVAVAAAALFTDHADRGLAVSAGITVLMAAAVGVVVAVVVTALHVPAWATSLAAGLGVLGWAQGLGGDGELPAGAYDPGRHAVLIVAGVVGLSVLGGVLGLIGGVRRGTGRYRPVGEPSRRSGGAAAAIAALVVSCALAGGAGVLMALSGRAASDGVGLTALALGIALLGGTSVYGRHGGLFGTALALAVVTLFTQFATAQGWRLRTLVVAAVAIGAGLLVSRLVETMGRSKALPPVLLPAGVQVNYEPARDDDIWGGNGSNGAWAAGDAERAGTDQRWDDRWAR